MLADRSVGREMLDGINAKIVYLTLENRRKSWLEECRCFTSRDGVGYLVAGIYSRVIAHTATKKCCGA